MVGVSTADVCNPDIGTACLSQRSGLMLSVTSCVILPWFIPCVAAKILKAREAELPGTVVLLFQPAEEGPGGAAVMISDAPTLVPRAALNPDGAYSVALVSRMFVIMYRA